MQLWFTKKASLEERVALLTERFKANLGDAVSSVVLYGSAAGGSWNPEHSDVNLVVELINDDAQTLDRAAALKPLLKKHNVSCQWFETGGIAAAADVFPVEILDLLLRRRVLMGADPLANTVVYRPDLRLACERIAREKLLTLRSQYFSACGDQAAMRSILLKSAPTWGALFQAILYLSDSKVPAELRERAVLCGEKLGIDSGAFQSLFEWRKQPSGGDIAFLMQLYRSYLQAVKVLVYRLDQWEIGS